MSVCALRPCIPILSAGAADAADADADAAATDAPAADGAALVPGAVGGGWGLGAALLQLSVAEGAHLQARVGGATLSGTALPLAEHLAELLLAALADDPWYRQPVALATSRLRSMLGSRHLQIDAALAAAASSQGGTLSLHLVGDAEGDAPCVLFRNSLNLIDFVTDVRGLYRAFASNIASQTPYAAASVAPDR